MQGIFLGVPASACQTHPFWTEMFVASHRSRAVPLVRQPFKRDVRLIRAAMRLRTFNRGSSTKAMLRQVRPVCCPGDIKKRPKVTSASIPAGRRVGP
jgi:hypothetical protein